MKMFLVAGFLVVSPAFVVVVWFLNRPTWFLPALASLVINSIPFIVAALILRAQKRKGAEFDAH